jgi:hypothetical protein
MHIYVKFTVRRVLDHDEELGALFEYAHCVHVAYYAEIDAVDGDELIALGEAVPVRQSIRVHLGHENVREEEDATTNVETKLSGIIKKVTFY